MVAVAAGILAGCAGGKGGKLEAEDLSITAGPETQVTTTYGTIEGFLDGGIYTFRGIPYAKSERFMEPQDPDRFEGVRMCKLYGPKAPQAENLLWRDEASQTDYTFGNNFVMEPMDEKGCQVLNVWTPSIKDGKKRPVFVWIHGGGYASGSGHDLPCYEGRSLAKKGDIVVVNLNHRLNVLGYLDLSAYGGKYANSVNLGMKDIIKALEWVHKNIDRFGGDPAQVTIGGQSGGGGKVSTLLAMPAAKGLFQRAVVQSGSAFDLSVPAKSQKYAAAVLEALGLNAASIDKIQDCSYEQLAQASRVATAKMATILGPQPRRFTMPGAEPVVDGKSIVQQPYDAVSPDVSKDVPLLVGTNFNEFSFAVQAGQSREDVLAQLRAKMGENTDAYVAAFEKAFPGAEPYKMLYHEAFFRKGAVAHATAKCRKEGGAKVWLYLFNWWPEVNALGASHGMELPFMFINVSLQREMTGGEARAYKLQEAISDAWLAFIKTGDPNTPALPAWEAYNEKDAPTMVFEDKSRLVRHLDDNLLPLMAE